MKLLGIEFDTSPVGLKEATRHMLAVSKYIVISMITVGLGLYIKNQHITMSELVTGMLLAGANLAYVFLQRWLTTTSEAIS